MSFFLRECTIGIVHVDDDIILGARGIAEWLDQPSLVRPIPSIQSRSSTDPELILIGDLFAESGTSLWNQEIYRPHPKHRLERRGRLILIGRQDDGRAGVTVLPRRVFLGRRVGSGCGRCRDLLAFQVGEQGGRKTGRCG